VTLTSDPIRQAGQVVTAFGLAWAVLGVVVLPVGDEVRVVLVLVAVAGAVAVAVACARLLAAVPRRPRRLPAAGSRDFLLVNAAQVVAVLVAVPLLIRAGAPTLIAPVTCLVVGLHFFPLARVFGQPQYRWTGTLLVIVAAVGAAAFVADAGMPTVFAMVGLPAASVLWATALHLAARG
jgi:hypothetical protein